MTAVTKHSLSNGEPILISLSTLSMPSRTAGQIDCGTYMREQAEHFCPLYSNADRIVPKITDWISAEACTKCIFFPPHSGKKKIKKKID